MNILGISASPSDYGFCFLRDGEMQSVIQHSGHSLDSLTSNLQASGVDLADIDLLAVCDRPPLQWHRIIKTGISHAPEGAGAFVKEALPWMRRHLWMKKNFGQESDFHGDVVFVGRHKSLAAAAFFQSGFSHAAVLTMDAGIELVTSSIGVGSLTDFSVLGEQYYPHSMEFLRSAFMPVLGISNGDVDSFSALASTGTPQYTDFILSELMDLKEDGSFRFDLDCFEHRHGLTVSRSCLHKMLGYSIDKPVIAGQEGKDIARSVQGITEEIFLRTVSHLRRVSGETRLCMFAGGAHSYLNGGTPLGGLPFEQVYVQDVCSGATGAALFARHCHCQ